MSHSWISPCPEAGDEATVQALGLQPDLKIITLSMYGEEVYYTRMMTAGAKGFLLKDSDFSEVIEAIDTVSAGGSYIATSCSCSSPGRTAHAAACAIAARRRRRVVVARAGDSGHGLQGAVEPGDRR